MPDDRVGPGRTLAALRSMTPARIFLPRAGSTLMTHSNLEFQLAHAEARDAVHEGLDFDSLAGRIRSRGWESIRVASAASDRRSFLLRPDLGRRLDEQSRIRLGAHPHGYDIVFVIADGLSSRAIASHALPLLDEALAQFHRSSWNVAPIVLVEQGRVAIGDEIGQMLEAELVAVLIGERPGLTSPDSLGAYLTFAPRIGRTDAERNCLSNIRAQGQSYADAARTLLYLCREARRRKVTGVALKDETNREIDSETPREIGSRRQNRSFSLK